MNKYKLLLISLIFSISFISCEKKTDKPIQMDKVLNKVSAKLRIDDKLELITSKLYDKYEQDILKDMEYKFHLYADIDKNNVKELYLGVKSVKYKKAYLFIIENPKFPKVLKHFIFDRTKLCMQLKESDNHQYLLIVFNLESEDNGDLVWEKDSYIFKPFNPDY